MSEIRSHTKKLETAILFMLYEGLKIGPRNLFDPLPADALQKPVPTTGLYSVAFSTLWLTGPTTSGRVCSHFLRVGVLLDMPVCTPIVGNSEVVATTSSAVIPMTAGDRIAVGTNETSSDVLTLFPGSGPSFTVTRLR